MSKSRILFVEYLRAPSPAAGLSAAGRGRPARSGGTAPPSLLFFSLALATCLILVTSCSRDPKLEARADPPRAVVVPVARATPANLSRELVLAAEFRPFQEIEVHAKVAGYVKKMYVDVGDRVKHGQLLATLEIPELADDLARAAAAKKRAEAELARARDELQRSESAHTVSHLSYTRLAAVPNTRPNLVAQQEIDEAMGRDKVSEAQIAAAKSALAAAEQQVRVAEADQKKIEDLLAYAQITAPFSGVITQRYADTGAMIQAGTASQTQAMPLVRLSQNDLLRLVLPVPETAASRIHVGAPVEVRAPTLNRSFPGKVARFSGKVQFSTRTMATEVDVPNPDLVLIPGMYAEAVLTLERRNDVLAIPVLALSGRESNSTVWVVTAEHRLAERPVKLGIETPHRVEILAGLKENELVLVGSRSQFRPGQFIEPKIVDLGELKGEP